MKEAYKQQITPKLGDAYTDFVFIPLNELKAFIERIEEQAVKTGSSVEAIKFHLVSQNTKKPQITLVLEGAFADKKVKSDLMNKFEFCPPFCDHG